MEVTQRKFADIFDVHPGTIRHWQHAGMPSLSAGPNRTYQSAGNLQSVRDTLLRFGRRILEPSTYVSA